MTDDAYKSKFVQTYLELIDLVNVLSEHPNGLVHKEVHEALARSDEFIIKLSEEL